MTQTRVLQCERWLSIGLLRSFSVVYFVLQQVQARTGTVATVPHQLIVHFHQSVSYKLQLLTMIYSAYLHYDACTICPQQDTIHLLYRLYYGVTLSRLKTSVDVPQMAENNLYKKG